jgi:hypothetical protein
MKLYEIDPLSDHRWDDLSASHPNSSAFHQTGWLKALAKTYGYRPMALTSARPGERLSDGIVFCEVNSWITGRRLVALPFSDHSEPLWNESSLPAEFANWMDDQRRRHDWKYIELRSLSWAREFADSLTPSDSFWLHRLDLTPTAQELFDGLHRSCLQRRILHAERQQLSYEKGCSDAILKEFYRLFTMTRRRFRLLPQPYAWFRNLIACMGQDVQIRIARKDGNAIAAILTLCHHKTVIYKYGCSDEALHHLGGMPFLFWKVIEESRTDGAELLDFGRTELSNNSLVAFKDRFGAYRTKLNYFRCQNVVCGTTSSLLNLTCARKIFSVLPSAFSSKLGQLAYRHIG